MRARLTPLVAASLPFLAACAGEKDSGGGPLVLKTERFTVEAGQEVTMCQTIHAKNAAMDFNHISSRLVEGSHHLILYRDLSHLTGDAPPAEGLAECGMEARRVYMYGAQEPVQETTLPEGIGGRVEEDTIFILEVHVANASPEPIEAYAEVTIDPAPAGSIQEYSGVLFYVNADFAIPPGAGIDGVPAYSESAVCDVPRDVNVYRLQSHTHKRASRVEGWLADTAAIDKQKIYKNEDWHSPVSRVFDNPHLAVGAGEKIRFECTWSNETDQVIEFGESVEDEMCILGLGYYPAITDGPLGLGGLVFCLDGDLYY